MTHSIEKLLYSVQEASVALSLGKTKIWELIKMKQLDTRKVGRRTLVTAASVRNFARSSGTNAEDYSKNA